MTTMHVKALACTALLLVIACGRDAPDVAQENLVVDVFALLSGGKRQVHPVQDQTLPKAIKITTNINEVAPGMPLVITREFLSEEEPWYCLRYGTGIGNVPWQISDTLFDNDGDGVVVVPLDFRKKTHCEYGLEEIIVTLGAKYGTDPFWKNSISLFIAASVKSYKPVPMEIELHYVIEPSSFNLIGRSTYSFHIPQVDTDTLRIVVKLVEGENN